MIPNFSNDETPNLDHWSDATFSQRVPVEIKDQNSQSSKIEIPKKERRESHRVCMCVRVYVCVCVCVRA
jgi:hypothetical protein